MRTCIIFNPTARGERAQRFRKLLESVAGSCSIRPTPAAETAHELAACAVLEGFDTIVAAGGDGTVNEVLNGIGAVPGGFTRARLGVLPMGTVNVFARELEIPMKLIGAWEVLMKGRETLIDLPQVTYQREGKTKTRFFAQMAGSGLDTRAVELVNWQLKKKIGQLAYIVAGLKAMGGNQSTIGVTSGTMTTSGELVLVGNGRFYGGRFPMHRNADLRDGLLDVCVFPKVNWFVLARYVLAYCSTRLYDRGKEKHFQAEQLSLTSSCQTLLGLEGENVGYLPATFNLQRLALRVVAPQ